MGQPQIPLWAELALDLLSWSFRQPQLTPQERDHLVSRGGDLLPRLAARKIDSLYYLASGKNAPAQRVYTKIWDLQKSACLQILRRFQEAQTPALLFKGAEFLSAWYDSKPLGLMYDIDLLVPRQFLGVAKQVLYSEGFRQAAFVASSGELKDRDIREVARIENVHYELAPFNLLRELDLDPDELQIARNLRHPVSVVGERCRILIEFDIHHGVATDLPSEPFFQRATPSATGLAMTLCPTDHLWFTLTRLYNEIAIHGKTALRDFAYVLPMIAKAPIDWDLLCAAADKHSLRSSLYYYLYFLDQLTRGAIPASVLDRLNPLVGRRTKDWGWQLEKLLGMPDPYPLEGYCLRFSTPARDNLMTSPP